MEQSEKDKIIAKLNEKGANNPCPRCNHSQFSLIDGYILPTLQKDIGNIVLGGQTIPTIIVACNNCGFLSHHALGALELLPPESERKDTK